MNGTAPQIPPLSRKKVWILRTTLYASIALLLFSVLAVIWSVTLVIFGFSTMFIWFAGYKEVFETADSLIPSMNSIIASAIAGSLLFVLYFILRWRFKKGAARAAKPPA